MAVTFLMSYKEFAQRVLSSVGDPRCRYFYPGEVQQWIDDAVRYVTYRLKDIDPEAVTDVFNPNLIAGQYEYAIERVTWQTLPSEVWIIRSVTVNGIPAKPAGSVEEFFRIKGGKLAHVAKTDAGPVYVNDRKQTILIWPAPEAPVTKGLYVRLIWCPKPMQDEDHDFPLPTMYVPAAQRYVEEKYFAAKGIQRPVTPEQAASHWLGVSA